MNSGYYKIPKSNSTRPAFGLWHPKEALLIIIIGVINFFVFSKRYEGTSYYFNAVVIPPAIFAALIMIIPDYNIRLISMIYKHVYYFVFLPKQYKYKKVEYTKNNITNKFNCGKLPQFLNRRKG